MNKSVTLLIVFLLISVASHAQVHLQNEPARPSAEAWQMTRYGDVSPSLYTGTVALSIPVYTYKDPDFEILVSLDYSSNGCVPNVRAGVLGPDWVLNAGGAITREIRGFPDEQTFSYSGVISSVDENISEPLHYDYTIYGYWSYYVNNAEISENNDTVQVSPDNRILTVPPTTLPFDYSGVVEKNLVNPGAGLSPEVVHFYDMEPDIFHFSMMGYTGSFCLQRDHQIRVFSTNIDPSNFSVDVSRSGGQSFSISITISDGYRFNFSDGDCIVRSDAGIANGSPSYTASSWCLDSIVAPNGRTVNFHYDEQNNVWDIRPKSFLYSGNIEGVGQSWSSCVSDFGTSTTISNQKHLKSIEVISKVDPEVNPETDPDFKIEFSYETHTENAVDSLFYVNCYRLSSIVVKYEEQTLRTCNLEYACDGESLSGTTFLARASISGIGDYEFEYINTLYPIYGTHAVDHWGYYNGKGWGCFLGISTEDYNFDEEFIANNSREPNPEYTKYGILKKIIYPTGGCSSFEYEANDYSKAVVRKSNTSFTPRLVSSNNIQQCGGVRIKTVSNYDADDSLLTKLSYTYRKMENDTMSSGILLYIPRYKLEYVTNRPNILNYTSPLTEHVVISSNNLTLFNQRVIEYSEVTATDLDGNSTRYKFTSSEHPDLLDKSYFYRVIPDSSVYASPSLNAANSISAPTTSFQFLRGRLTSSSEYDNVGELLHSTENHYSYSSTDVTSSTDFVVSLTGLIYQKRDRADYAGRCYLSSTADKSFHPQGNLTSSRSYEYNDYGQISCESCISSDGHRNSTFYTYATDTSDIHTTDTLVSAVYAQMKDKNAISRPVRIDKAIDSTEVSSTEISYVQIGGESSYLFRESSRVETDLVNNVVTTTTFQYDKYGHMIEKVVNGTHHTTYIWGYGGLYLVGIVDNCPLSTVRLLAGVSCITDYPIETTVSTPDASILRGFGSFTLFDYEPYVGLTRVIDPDGKETVFNYNESGKLSSTNNASNKKTAGYLYSPDNSLTE